MCQDEEANLARCLESLAFCDEIVVVDSGSSDATVESARRFTDRIVHHEVSGYVEQQNFAIDLAKRD